MNRGRRIPNWLRRGLEAGVVSALLSAGTLVAFEASRPSPRLTLPHGLDGMLILLPAVLSLGVLAIAYPTLLSATRPEARLGGVAAFLVAADVLMLFSLLQRESVYVHVLSRGIPLGVVGVTLAVPVAVVAVVAGQLSATPGFGRSAGLRSVVAGSVATLTIVLIAGFAL
jgi:hypothetical protein